jgi:tRNA dimethylallyltransferase
LELPALVIVGPTAVGKTELAIEVAERFQTEIISADSMQIYRGMSIGTAAPSHGQLARVKHHFVATVDPSERFSAAEFERQALKVAADLWGRGNVPVVVGGSGLYVRAFVDGLFPAPGADGDLRTRLRTVAENDGVDCLYNRLAEVDPAAAQKIHAGDLRRIVRALEVYELTGVPISQLHARHRRRGVEVNPVMVGISRNRAQLNARIDARVETMFAEGFLEEVRGLLDEGYREEIERIAALGYREAVACVSGEIEIAEAVALTKRNSRRYAKRQMTWFRKEKRISWYELLQDVESTTLADKITDRVHDSLRTPSR